MNDRDVYLKLAEMAQDLMSLSEAAESVVGEMALQTAASTIARHSFAVGTGRPINPACSVDGSKIVFERSVKRII